MASVTVFSTLDARSGFWQIKLDYESHCLPDVAWNHLRSVVFQRSIEELFAGYPCAMIVDDPLVWGEGTPKHDGN